MCNSSHGGMGNQTASWNGSWQQQLGLRSFLVHGTAEWTCMLCSTWNPQKKSLQTLRCKEDPCTEYHGKPIDNPDAATTRLASMDIKHVVTPPEQQWLGQNATRNNHNKCKIRSVENCCSGSASWRSRDSDFRAEAYWIKSGYVQSHSGEIDSRRATFKRGITCGHIAGRRFIPSCGTAQTRVDSVGRGTGKQCESWTTVSIRRVFPCASNSCTDHGPDELHVHSLFRNGNPRERVQRRVYLPEPGRSPVQTHSKIGRSGSCITPQSEETSQSERRRSSARDTAQRRSEHAQILTHSWLRVATATVLTLSPAEMPKKQQFKAQGFACTGRAESL